MISVCLFVFCLFVVFIGGDGGGGCVVLYLLMIALSMLKVKKKSPGMLQSVYPASILRKSTSGRHRPVSYPDGPMTARYRFT